MAVRKVHGSYLSTATMRVITCLHEKNIDFEFVPVDLTTEANKKEPHISLNPFGQVPAFEDDDLKLFESRAITMYLSYVYAGSGNQLIETDTKKMAMLSVWMEVEAHQFEPAASKLTWELAIKPMIGIPVDTAIVEEHEAKLAKVLDVYEARLSQSKYLGGESFSLADLHHLPDMNYLMDTQVKKLFESRPRVKAWCTDIMARPTWSKVVAMQKEA